VKSKQGIWHVNYVTVIIVHYNSCSGAGCFYESLHEYPNYRPSIRERLLNEVRLSVETALAIESFVGERIFEVHLDINPDPKHGSAVAIKEAIGWVIGQGFKCKVKPEAFAASRAADNFVRKTA